MGIFVVDIVSNYTVFLIFRGEIADERRGGIVRIRRIKRMKRVSAITYYANVIATSDSNFRRSRRYKMTIMNNYCYSSLGFWAGME